MKTITIITASLIALTVNAFSAEGPVREDIKVRAQYVLPGSEPTQLNRGSLFHIRFPGVSLEHDELSGMPASSGTFRFKNPQAITEEGLTEEAFLLTYPKPVIGDPSEIVVPVSSEKFQFKNPKAITEEGLNEKVFKLSYPAPVIGSVDDIQAEELKLIAANK